ncbi:MAG: transglutaminase family protein [Marmoricola sp.]
MQLRIVHTTGYEYDEQVAASYNEARLTPLTQAGQIVTQSRLDITPVPWTQTYRDHWGTQVTAFEVLDAHTSLRVVGTSTVHTEPAAPSIPSLEWSDLDDLVDDFAEYLIVLPRVQPPDDLYERVLMLRDSCATPRDAALAICDFIHHEVEYRPGSTQVQTAASTAWAQRTGVCQDLAHLVIGCLRSLDIPARYVSGYLHPSRDPEVGVPVAGESHAWIEWWDGAWCGFDPTNNEPPCERHVVVATGRNYDDVRPLAGVFSGTGTASRMVVDVQITRLA